MGHDLKQSLKGTIAGGVAIFLAHGFGWGALPFANKAILDLNDPAALAAVQGHAAKPGTYFVNADLEREGLAVAGAPWGWMTLHAPDAYASQQSGAFLRGLLINLAWALIASWMVLTARLTAFGARLRLGLALASRWPRSER